MNKFRHTPLPEVNDLWVVTVVSNPQRYKSRYELYKRFKHAVDKAGANLMTVEIAFGCRPFEVTEAGNPNHVQLRSHTEMWNKENALNIGISRLPVGWKYVAWVDADIEFLRHDWPMEIVHQLQHFDVIQLFQNAIDLGPTGETIRTMNGFIYSWMEGHLDNAPTEGNYYYGKNGKVIAHPGYCWAARREAIDDLGGLIDFAILGAGDHHMAWALVGKALEHCPKDVTPSYKKHIEIWQERASNHIRENIGYMPGSIIHHFHGAKKKRFYQDRWKILTKHNYNPEWDIQRDSQGLFTLSDRGLRMRNDLRAYFMARDEDSTEVG